jgi:hypothetical protein
VALESVEKKNGQSKAEGQEEDALSSTSEVEMIELDDDDEGDQEMTQEIQEDGESSIA